MFNAIHNIKHKAILFTAYSAGLRVSEVVNLKIKDVDSERMQLFIEKAKGKKDRYVRRKQLNKNGYALIRKRINILQQYFMQPVWMSLIL